LKLWSLTPPLPLSSGRYPIKPERRFLKTVQETNKVGASQREVTFERDIYMIDIPFEKTMQRELHYNSNFAEHFRDFGELPRVPGVYAGVQDGYAARSHPELGNDAYVGPPRLAFGYYNDAVEVVCPLGAAKGKHKVELHYAVILNQPNHVRSKMDSIFLVGVVLAKDQAAVGSSLVVQGPPDEPENGTSFGASMRRMHKPEGVVFQVLLPGPVSGLSPGPVSEPITGPRIMGAVSGPLQAPYLGCHRAQYLVPYLCHRGARMLYLGLPLTPDQLHHPSPSPDIRFPAPTGKRAWIQLHTADGC
jgi:hypothetical protein